MEIINFSPSQKLKDDGDDAANIIGARKVTDIKQSLKDENRVNIFIDYSFAFSLDIAQVVDYKLKVGKALSDLEIDRLERASSFGKLYQNTLEWVLNRPHSIKETREHLVTKQGKREMANRQALRNRERTKEDRQKYKLRTRELPNITDEDIEQVVTKLIEKGYLDDAKFARYYIENRFARKGISQKRLKQELQQKGLDSEVIGEALDATERSDDEEIQKIIAKKRNKYTDDKLIAYLVRQGFDYQRVKAAVHGMD